jgi:DNA-directed RNA polymerase subunit RPC12/RpoP
MYAVVGCSECSNLWMIEGRSETTQCPRCGSRKAYEKRKKFVETDDADHARDVRASMLANRQGEGDAFAKLDSFADLEDDVAGGVVDDAEYLEASGLDVDEVEAAGDRDPRGSSRSGSKKEIVERALAELERPTENEVVEYAGERGVSAEYVRNALEKLARRGEVSESRGRYRRL